MPGTIGNLFVGMELDSAAFIEQMKATANAVTAAAGQMAASIEGVEASLGSMLTSAKGLAAAFAIKEVVDFSEKAIDLTAHIRDVSAATGLTTDQFQQFAIAANEVGVNTDKFTAGIQRFAANLGAAAEGTGALYKALQIADPVLLEQLTHAQSTGEAFQILADKLSKLPEGEERARLAFVAFGRGMVELADINLQVAKSLAGIIIPESVIEAGHQLKVQMELVGTAIENGFATGLVAAFADNLNISDDELIKINKAAAQFGLIIGASLDVAITGIKGMVEPFEKFLGYLEDADNLLKKWEGDAGDAGSATNTFLQGAADKIAALAEKFKGTKLGEFFSSAFTEAAGNLKKYVDEGDQGVTTTQKVKDAVQELIGVAEGLYDLGKGLAVDQVAGKSVTSVKDLQEALRGVVDEQGHLKAADDAVTEFFDSVGQKPVVNLQAVANAGGNVAVALQKIRNQANDLDLSNPAQKSVSAAQAMTTALDKVSSSRTNFQLVDYEVKKFFDQWNTAPVVKIEDVAKAGGDVTAAIAKIVAQADKLNLSKPMTATGDATQLLKEKLQKLQDAVAGKGGLVGNFDQLGSALLKVQTEIQAQIKDHQTLIQAIAKGPVEYAKTKAAIDAVTEARKLGLIAGTQEYNQTVALIEKLKLLGVSEKDTAAAYQQAQTPLDQFNTKLGQLNNSTVDAMTYAQDLTQDIGDLGNAYLQGAQDITSALTTAFGKNKEFAIANAIVNTAEAISKALASPLGFPMNFAMAAAAAAAGAAQIATIESTQPGSTTKPTVGASTASVSSGSGRGASSGPSHPQSINVQIIGDSFNRVTVESLVNQLKQYQKDGGSILIN